MIKEIRYTGYTTTPSDYESPDGDLATAINCVAEEGGLKAVLPPKILFQLPLGRKVCFVHTATAYTHYIATDADTGYIYWYDANGNEHEVYSDSNLNPLNFNAVGNTLIVLSATEIHYILWKDDAYKYLGNKIPDIDISFGLVGHPKLYSRDDEEKSTFDLKLIDNDESAEFNDDTKTSVTNTVMAKLNKFIAEESTNKGRFCFPFFVRYALRLYDGSYTCHSAPILMQPGSPMVLVSATVNSKGYLTGKDCDIFLVAADLDYHIMNPSALNGWSDIISGIDIFVSKPIYPYDQSAECLGFNGDEPSAYEKVFVGRLPKNSTEDSLTNYVYPDTLLENAYAEWDYYSIYRMYILSTVGVNKINNRVRLANYDAESMEETYLSTSTFFKLSSIAFDDLSLAGRNVIEISDDYLQSLLTRESLTDEYLSHDRLAASYAFNYNSRINLAGITRYPYKGFSPASMFCFKNCDAWLIQIDGYSRRTIRYSTNDGYVFNDNDYLNGYLTGEDFLDVGNTTIEVYMNDNSTPVKVSSSSGTRDEVSWLYQLGQFFSIQKDGNYVPTYYGCYLYYPNINATRMVITNTNIGSYEVKLKQHEFLNGAVAYIQPSTIRKPQTIKADTQTYYSSIEVPNKIYTSEVNNPFFFPVSTINTVGTGRIIGLCTAAKALSQGQFGSFPLYAFATDGVWALEVSSTNGAFSARQPITRDVCISSDSITQMDSYVLFASARGIMQLSGSTATCISDTLNISQSNNLLGTSDEKIAKLTGIENVEVVPFIQYLSACRMLYDYVHQHVIVFNPAYSYAYIISMKSKQWGLINYGIDSAINSYPKALCMDVDNNLVDYSESGVEPDAELPFYLITRPIKLDGPDILKTVDTVIQRGYFQKGNIQSALYGSRDLYNWFLLMSSSDHYLRGKFGTPYKYFKVFATGSLQSNESVAGCTVQYTPRFTSRPR